MHIEAKNLVKRFKDRTVVDRVSWDPMGRERLLAFT